MKKSTRQLLTLVVLIAVLGGLAAAYFGIGARQEQIAAAAAASEEDEETGSGLTRLIHHTEFDLVRVTYESEQRGSFTIEALEDEDGVVTWVYAGDHSVELNQADTRSMLRDVFALNAVEMVLENVDNPEDYGIGSVVATAYFDGGERYVVRVGSMTPDHNRFYLMLDGDPALYLITAVAGGRFNQGVEDLVQRTFETVEAELMTTLIVRERGQEPIEFAFDGTEEEKNELLESFGMIWLTMVHPFPGRALNFQNFEMIALDGFDAFQAGEIVDLFPEDTSIYGFDDPQLEFIVEDVVGRGFHLIFGDFYDDRYIYMMFYGRPHVFLTERRFINNLFGLNPFSFVDRFLYLANIVEVERVVLEAPIGRYVIYINNFRDEDERDQIAPVVNGQEVQDRAFRSFYQAMIGLILDIDVGPQGNMGAPEIVITYYKVDRSEPPVVVELYVYDAHFYVGRRDNEPLQHAINRLTVNAVFTLLESLLAGELDR